MLPVGDEFEGRRRVELSLLGVAGQALRIAKLYSRGVMGPHAGG